MIFAALLIATGFSLAGGDAAATRTVVEHLNEKRAERREGPLTLDPQLTAVAQDRASDLLRRHYFSHVSPDGTTCLDDLRSRAYSFGYAGENLAEAQTLAAAEAELWASPDHRENILEPHFKRIGIAVVRTPGDGQFMVQIFTD